MRLARKDILSDGCPQGMGQQLLSTPGADKRDLKVVITDMRVAQVSNRCWQHKQAVLAFKTCSLKHEPCPN